MRIAISHTGQLRGLEAEMIRVEVDISNGLHAFSIVGLGDRAVGEARDRISAAIKNSGYVSPKQKNQKVVISLAPARIRKEGPSFDLAMAVAYLRADGEVAGTDTDHTLIFGELSLDGSVKRVDGLLPILCQARSKGFTSAIIPKDNSDEALLAPRIKLYAVSSLGEAIRHMSGEAPIPPLERPTKEEKLLRDEVVGAVPTYPFNMDDVRGNETAKRCLLIAAAGGHNIILCGPPGTGKTMLARSIPSILPPLGEEQAMEVTGIYSAAKLLNGKMGIITLPPFRAPHHTSSATAIMGGGPLNRPGEITLAHHGVLFLDEFPEFNRQVIESLRQPLEDRVVSISRASGSVIYPARCVFVAAMNPCPCGKGEGAGCTCTPNMRAQYRRKISSSVLDRIDMWVDVFPVDRQRIAGKANNADHQSNSFPQSDMLRHLVALAWKKQKERFGRSISRRSVFRNADMTASQIENHIIMDDGARQILADMSEKLGFSGRAIHRVMKVAQTIRDIDDSIALEDDPDLRIEKRHVLEAIQYRPRFPIG